MELIIHGLSSDAFSSLDSFSLLCMSSDAEAGLSSARTYNNSSSFYLFIELYSGYTRRAQERITGPLNCQRFSIFFSLTCNVLSAKYIILYTSTEHPFRRHLYPRLVVFRFQSPHKLHKLLHQPPNRCLRVYSPSNPADSCFSKPAVLDSAAAFGVLTSYNDDGDSSDRDHPATSCDWAVCDPSIDLICNQMFRSCIDDQH